MSFGPDELQLPANCVELNHVLQGPRGVEVLEGWQIAANYLLIGAKDLLWSALISDNVRTIQYQMEMKKVGDSTGFSECKLIQTVERQYTEEVSF